MTIEEQLQHIAKNFEITARQFEQIGENFRQTNENFRTMAERMNQQTDAIDKLLAETTKLQAIVEIDHYRIRRLENPGEPTAELPTPKDREGKKQ